MPVHTRPMRQARLVALMVATLLGLAESGRAWGQGSRTGERPTRLLVGVRQYYATDLRPLDFADADVTELAQVLLDQGYRRENVVLMTLETAAPRNVRRLPMGNRVRHGS